MAGWRAPAAGGTDTSPFGRAPSRRCAVHSPVAGSFTHSSRGRTASSRFMPVTAVVAPGATPRSVVNARKRRAKVAPSTVPSGAVASWTASALVACWRPSPWPSHGATTTRTEVF